MSGQIYNHFMNFLHSKKSLCFKIDPWTQILNIETNSRDLIKIWHNTKIINKFLGGRYWQWSGCENCLHLNPRCCTNVSIPGCNGGTVFNPKSHINAKIRICFIWSLLSTTDTATISNRTFSWYFYDVSRLCISNVSTITFDLPIMSFNKLVNNGSNTNYKATTTLHSLLLLLMDIRCQLAYVTSLLLTIKSRLEAHGTLYHQCLHYYVPCFVVLHFSTNAEKSRSLSPWSE